MNDMLRAHARTHAYPHIHTHTHTRADDEAWKESCDSAFTTSDGSGRESNKKSDAKLVAQLNWAPMLIGLALSMVLETSEHVWEQRMRIKKHALQNDDSRQVADLYISEKENYAGSENTPYFNKEKRMPRAEAPCNLFTRSNIRKESVRIRRVTSSTLWQ
eukprot:1156148-Pelagomonas_calceolata.AAC.1